MNPRFLEFEAFQCKVKFSGFTWHKNCTQFLLKKFPSYPIATLITSPNQLFFQFFGFNVFVIYTFKNTFSINICHHNAKTHPKKHTVPGV
jgi:hypothetical protein